MKRSNGLTWFFIGFHAASAAVASAMAAFVIADGRREMAGVATLAAAVNAALVVLNARLLEE